MKTNSKNDVNSNPIPKIQKREFKTPKKIIPTNSLPSSNTRILSTTKQKSTNSTPTSHKIDMLAGLLDDKPPTRIETPKITRKRIPIKQEEEKVMLF